MIEAIMFFTLGFLAATLIALVTLSAVWHRAVRLTTKRIEGAIPVSMAEIQADKDQLRAEFAMALRRMENSVEQLRTRSSEQLAEIGRKSESIRVLKNEVEARTSRIAELEGIERSLRARLHATEEDLSAASRMAQETQATLAAREQELGETRKSLDAVTSEAESQRIEIAALMTERETLKTRIEIFEREMATMRQGMADERQKLMDEAENWRSQAEKASTEERLENALLRERLNDVAAEVARIAIRIDGPNSEIKKILASERKKGARQNGGERRLSLADRIRDLQARAR